MLVFHDTRPNGTPNNASLHESCPVLGGTKTVISRFVRANACPLNKNFSKRKWNGNVGCVDDHTGCAELAAAGACEDKAQRMFMVGNDVIPGFCEATCRACTRPVEPSVLELRESLRKATLPPDGAPEGDSPDDAPLDAAPA